MGGIGRGREGGSRYRKEGGSRYGEGRSVEGGRKGKGEGEKFERVMEGKRKKGQPSIATALHEWSCPFRSCRIYAQRTLLKISCCKYSMKMSFTGILLMLFGR